MWLEKKREQFGMFYLSNTLMENWAITIPCYFKYTCPLKYFLIVSDFISYLILDDLMFSVLRDLQ